MSHKGPIDALIWLDAQVLRVVTLGKSKPGETISACVWDLRLDGKWQGRIFAPLIDLLFRPWMTEHCRKAWVSQYTLYAGENKFDGTTYSKDKP